MPCHAYLVAAMYTKNQFDVEGSNFIFYRHLLHQNLLHVCARLPLRLVYLLWDKDVADRGPIDSNGSRLSGLVQRRPPLKHVDLFTALKASPTTDLRGVSCG